MNNFFPWLRWVFSKHLRCDVNDCVFNPWKEPEPNHVKIEIDMAGLGNTSFSSYTGGVHIDNQEPFIIPSNEDELPFQIVAVPEVRLTEEERLSRFCDALHNWNDRMEHYEITNMRVDVDKICNKDEK